MQELLAVLQTIGTWPELVAGAAWTAWIDSDAVLHAIINGGGCGPEVNSLVGRLWVT